MSTSLAPHPNFPPSLSITPNETYHNFSFSSQGSPHDDHDGAFGIQAQREAISKYGIAGRIWEAAHSYEQATSAALAAGGPLEFDPPFVDDSRGSREGSLVAIELGSGTGAVAAQVAQMMCHDPGAFIIATDLPDVCPLLEQNLDTRDGSIFVRPLAWGSLGHAMSIAKEFKFALSQHSGCQSANASRRLTHIVCSDLAKQVYFPELFGPLLRTLIHLTAQPSSCPPVKLVISYKIRSLTKETPFWTAFGLWFSFQPILARRRIPAARLLLLFGADDGADRTFIFVASRRPESVTWDVPVSDRDLMEGVGAKGTPVRKGDDTFETILFMGIDDTGCT
ncbi:hypothetical protein BU15DRAFT_52886 [Melanogaster broomeanus]|nr:hypothetical protein BU15DRAFT_52886 [Melanogaster broomeanus]